MRRMVLSLVSAVALALTGCNAPSPTASNDANAPTTPGTAANAGSTGNGTAADAPIGNEVTGTVALREPAQLSANARLDIRLVDVSADAPTAEQALASKTVMPATQFPQSFQLTFDPAQVRTGDLYVVQVTLVDGDHHYTMPIQAPVLTKGSPHDVTITLVAQLTEGEKMLAAFNEESKQLGAMKITRGTKLEKDASRGWQLFREAGQVKFIRELVEYTAKGKGFTNTDYAYKEGKPWVVVQQNKSSSDAKPSSIERAGWDEDGTLVLKEEQKGDATQSLDADDAAKLRAQAVDVLSLATDGKNK